MPPRGKKERRVLCPYCSGEYAEGYLWLHKRDFCPMRPGRHEQLSAEVMGISIPPGVASMTIAGPNAIAQYNNITPINLMEEYNNMVKVMQKKKDEEVEIGEEYQCGACNTTFHGKKEPKHCPECGIEFA